MRMAFIKGVGLVKDGRMKLSSGCGKTSIGEVMDNKGSASSVARKVDLLPITHLLGEGSSHRSCFGWEKKGGSSSSSEKM